MARPLGAGTVLTRKQLRKRLIGWLLNCSKSEVLTILGPPDRTSEHKHIAMWRYSCHTRRPWRVVDPANGQVDTIVIDFKSGDVDSVSFH